MIALKTNPVGIDAKIQVLQKKLYEVLVNKWNISNTKYNCYPRCYRNQTESNNWAAEVFDGKDYTEVYFNDTVSAVSFFGQSNETQITDGTKMLANIHLIFFVNLAEIKPGNERNDEEARIDVQSILDSYGASTGFAITKQTTGIDKILNEYPGTRNSEGLKFRDLHPLHCFRFDCQLIYQPTLIKC